MMSTVERVFELSQKLNTFMLRTVCHSRRCSGSANAMDRQAPAAGSPPTSTNRILAAASIAKRPMKSVGMGHCPFRHFDMPDARWGLKQPVTRVSSPTRRAVRLPGLSHVDNIKA